MNRCNHLMYEEFKSVLMYGVVIFYVKLIISKPPNTFFYKMKQPRTSTTSKLEGSTLSCFNYIFFKMYLLLALPVFFNIIEVCRHLVSEVQIKDNFLLQKHVIFYTCFCDHASFYRLKFIVPLALLSKKFKCIPTDLLKLLFLEVFTNYPVC